MDEINTVLFDPGYAPLAIDSMGAVGYNYYVFSAIPDLKLKRLNFIPIAKKIEHHLKISISFYLGCLLWANYIKQFKNYKIEGNKLYGEKCSEEEYTGEIDFLIDFIENKYPRDYKYFLSKPFKPNEKYLPVLKAYREFLIINDGFVNCNNTNDVKIPSSVKAVDKQSLEKVNDDIRNAIEKKDLTLLLEDFNYLF